VRTALVTGAGGFIGSHLVRRLVQDGVRVRGLCRDARQGWRLAHAGAEPFRGDVTDTASTARGAEGIEVVFHCATGGTTATSAHLVNVTGTANVLEAAATAGVRRVVHVSSMAVHPPGASELTEDAPLRTSGGPYALSKAEGERTAWAIAERRALPLTVLRPGIVYGPGSPMWTLGMLERVRSMRLALIDGGRAAANLVYVDDLVDALLLAATEPAAPGESFLVSSATPDTWAVYLSHLARMARRPQPASLPLWRARLSAMSSTWRQRVTGRPGRVEPADLNLMVRSSIIRIDKARRLLGFQPKVTLDDGMRRTEAWLRAEGYLPSAPVAPGWAA